jgi:hypothetical protein
VDIPVDRARWRLTLSGRLHPRLLLGVEVNPGESEIGPLANVILLTETDRRPTLFLGTSSDRIGSPAGRQSYYATAAKRLGDTPIAPYVTLNWSEWDEGFNVPFGVDLSWGSAFVRPMYDGERSHLVAGWQRDALTVSALWVWFEHAGISLSYGI